MNCQTSLMFILCIMLVGPAAGISFEEPATIEGSIHASGNGTIFISFPDGEAKLHGPSPARLWESKTIHSPTGSSKGARLDHDSKDLPDSAIGKSISRATLEVSGNWNVVGFTEGKILNSKHLCVPDYSQFSNPICSEMGGAWGKLEIRNFVLTSDAINSIWTDMHWHDSLPSSAIESTKLGSGGASFEITTILENEILQPHKITLKAAIAEIYLTLETFDIEGSIELPNYNDDSVSAPNLVAEGVFEFRNMTFKNGRFEADMSGEAEAARLDNEIVSSDSLGLAAISVASSAAVSILIWKTLTGTLVAGFTRMSMDDALEHPKRQKVYGYIISNPGATFREVVRETGFATGTTRHHLTILKRSNAIMEQKYLQTLRYFENHGKFTETWDTIALLREEPLAQLHDWLKENPWSNQKAILAAMAEVGWSRSTAQHRLSRLVDGGLVAMRPQGRMNLYEAQDQVMR